MFEKLKQQERRFRFWSTQPKNSNRRRLRNEKPRKCGAFFWNSTKPINESFLFPGTAAVLVIPTGSGLAAPTLSERFANIRFPLGMTVGSRNLPIKVGSICILIGN